MIHPQIPDAPGLIWRRLKSGGWAAHWQCQADIRSKGFTPKSVRLWSGPESDLTLLAIDFIKGRANVLQNEMIMFRNGGIPTAGGTFNGTVKDLVRCYQTDEDSPYRKKRFHTRRYYDTLCRRLVKDLGHEDVADLKGRQIHRWYEAIAAEGKIAMAHALVGMLRTLAGFGASLLECEECLRVSIIMGKMRFEMGKSRVERLTAEHVVAIRAKAHELGKHSIALAQAFQFELMLRQKDVIGEWVPASEPGLSVTVRGNEKWLRGIRWNEIDANLVLKHVTSKRQKEIEVNLNNAPMVMEELALLPSIPNDGPVVVSEYSGWPYSQHVFRREWRKIAKLCGVPASVRNMDSRAGAISEATDAGAELEHVRQAATHSDIAMTQKYSRNAVDKTANVQKKRAEFRNKAGT